MKWWLLDHLTVPWTYTAVKKTACFFQCPISPRVPWALLVWLSLQKMPQVISHVHKLYPQVPRLFDLFRISSDPLAKGMVTIKCRLKVQSLWWWGEDGILGAISVNSICHKPWANDLKKEGRCLDSPRLWFKAFLALLFSIIPKVPYLSVYFDFWCFLRPGPARQHQVW